MSFGIIEEFVLLAVLPFEVVYVALIIINGFELLLHQLKREVGKQKALHKSQDAADKRVWVALREARANERVVVSVNQLTGLFMWCLVRTAVSKL
jgi:hypothetical protein